MNKRDRLSVEHCKISMSLYMKTQRSWVYAGLASTASHMQWATHKNCHKNKCHSYTLKPCFRCKYNTGWNKRTGDKPWIHSACRGKHFCLCLSVYTMVVTVCEQIFIRPVFTVRQAMLPQSNFIPPEEIKERKKKGEKRRHKVRMQGVYVFAPFRFSHWSFSSSHVHSKQCRQSHKCGLTWSSLTHTNTAACDLHCTCSHYYVNTHTVILNHEMFTEFKGIFPKTKEWMCEQCSDIIVKNTCNMYIVSL